MATTGFRKLSVEEKSVFENLLNTDFQGKDIVKRQVLSSSVKCIDENGSLKFDVQLKEKAFVNQRVPVEAEYEDSDGILVHVLLHVVDGYVDELEIYKEDSSTVRKKLHGSDLKVIVLEAPPKQ